MKDNLIFFIDSFSIENNFNLEITCFSKNKSLFSGLFDNMDLDEIVEEIANWEATFFTTPVIAETTDKGEGCFEYVYLCLSISWSPYRQNNLILLFI